MAARITPATPSRRITWFTLVGLVLVPLAAGAVLLAGLWDPTQRLEHVTAAVVNQDEPVTIDDQLVPLGRQLAAGLIDGAGQAGEQTNYTWVLTDASDAQDGLANGAYTAVVTIPKGFSAAATSTAGGAASARQATIAVQTTDRSRALDDALTTVITATARGVFNTSLTARYLENVFVGFSDVHDALMQSAAGATRLSGGATQLADGTGDLAGGAADLAAGMTQLEDGAADLSSGLRSLSSGVAASAAGASQLAGGAAQAASGADRLATSAGQIAAGTAAAGRAAATTNAGVRAVAGDLAALGAAYAACADDPVGCQSGLASAMRNLPTQQELTALATAAGTADGYLNGNPAAPNAPGLVAGTTALAGGASSLSTGVDAVASGAGDLSSGLARLRSGAGSAASGAGDLTGGVAAAADGARQLASGAEDLAGGADELQDGVARLSDGLTTAAQAVPAYSDSERKELSAVAAEPLAAGSTDLGLGGAPVAALLASVALWLGGLASWLLLAPVPPGALGSTRSSLHLAVRNALPGVGVGLAQGLAVGLLMLTVLDLDGGSALGFVVLAVLAGLACALVQQGLAGLLGGVGRFVGVVVGAAALAAGVVSTAPSWLTAIVSVTPVGTALDALLDAANGQVHASAVLGLAAWAGLGLLLSQAATARSRSVRVGTARSRAVLQLSPQPH